MSINLIYMEETIEESNISNEIRKQRTIQKIKEEFVPGEIIKTGIIKGTFIDKNTIKYNGDEYTIPDLPIIGPKDNTEYNLDTEEEYNIIKDGLFGDKSMSYIYNI